MIKIKIKNMDGDYKYFSLILRTGGQKICKMLKASMFITRLSIIERGDISFLLHKLTVHT